MLAPNLLDRHRYIDLAAPDLSSIDIRRDIAEPLARLARWCGHLAPHPDASGRIWSVAQHCVVGAKALAVEAGPVAGLAFLVHDAHEALIGDLTPPTVAAIGRVLGDRPGLDRAVSEVKRRLDAEIRIRAGLGRIPRDVERLVAMMDDRMAATELRQLLGTDPSRDTERWPFGIAHAAPVRTHGALSLWTQKRAADEWMALWDAWRIRAEPATAA